MLDSFDHSIELARFTHAQFRKITEMSPRNNLDTKAGFLFTSQRHETLEMLDRMLYSFDHPEQSSTEQGRAEASKVVCFSVKGWIRLTRALVAHQDVNFDQLSKKISP